MGDQAWGDFITHLLNDKEVVSGELLICLFVGHLEAADSMVTQFDGDKQYISNYLV